MTEDEKRDPRQHTTSALGKLTEAESRVTDAAQEADIVSTLLLGGEAQGHILASVQGDQVEAFEHVQTCIDSLEALAERAKATAKQAKAAQKLAERTIWATKRHYQEMLREGAREKERRDKAKKGPLFGDQPPVEAGPISVTLTAADMKRVSENLKGGRKRN